MSCLALFASLLLAGGAASAQSAATVTGHEPPESAMNRAKERFERGRELFKQQQWAAALAEFLESRRLHPTLTGAAHAATCLKKLGRFDESLDMFAALLREFGEKMSPEAKQKTLQEIEETRRLVGTIEIDGAEPGATVVVDQQPRGDYPLLEPLRVAAGSHIVRVFKEGYEPFETRLDVAGNTTARASARLRKL
jgi:hypothetical protein